MRREFVTIGFLDRGVVAGHKIRNPMMKEIYSAAKTAGFHETVWQYIFDGQIGGLVLPYRDGHYEFHVRFYADRIFAECEVNRGCIAHFFASRYNATELTVSLLRPLVSKPTERYLVLMAEANTWRDDEKFMANWHSGIRTRHGDVQQPYVPRCMETIYNLSWSILVLFGVAAAVIAAMVWAPDYLRLWIVTLLLGLLCCHTILPRRGKP